MPDSQSLHGQHAAVDNAPCGLLTTDGKGLILQANKLFCRWVETEASELLGIRRLQDLFTMGGRIFLQTHWMPLLQMQGSIAEVKLEILAASGALIPVVMNASRRQTDVGVVHDIALFVARDRDRYEKELLAVQGRLEQLVLEEKRLVEQAHDRASYAEQLVGIVSHDLRNPLSAIQLGIAALTRSKPTEQQQRIIDRISRSANRTNRLIADLLDFTQARLGSGLVANRDAIDIHAVVADAVDELSTVFPQRQFKHVMAGAGNALGDIDRLVQLLGNLVANAAAYGEPGTPIRVTSALYNEHYTLSVHNSGRPIPDDLRGRLFQPLVRGDMQAGEASSVGLGLYIVDAIVKAHDGSIVVSSTAEFGTCFTATFPRT